MPETKQAEQSTALAKFTPGPWEVHGAIHVVKYGEDGRDIAVVLNRGEKFVGTGTPARIGDFGWDEAVANARLIAAAPDLYEALLFVKQFFQNLDDSIAEDDPLKKLRRKFHAPIHQRLDAVLAKAVVA